MKVHKNSSRAKKLTSVLGVTSEDSCILGFLFGVLKGVDLGECPFVADPLAFVAAEEGEEAATPCESWLGMALERTQSLKKRELTTSHAL